MTPVFLDHEKSPVCMQVSGKEHTDLFLQIQNNPATRQYLARDLPLTKIAEDKWFLDRSSDPNNISFVVAKKLGGKSMYKPIGSMGFHQIDWKNRRATSGAAMLEGNWGQGLGSAAKMLLLSYGFLELGLNKVESRVLATNPRSKSYNLKCGYTQVGLLKEHDFHDGRFVDEIVMEVHAKDWLPLWEKFKSGEFLKKKEE